VLECWQEAAGAGAAVCSICDERRLVLEVGQKWPPLQQAPIPLHARSISVCCSFIVKYRLLPSQALLRRLINGVL